MPGAGAQQAELQTREPGIEGEGSPQLESHPPPRAGSRRAGGAASPADAAVRGPGLSSRKPARGREQRQPAPPRCGPGPRPAASRALRRRVRGPEKRPPPGGPAAHRPLCSAEGGAEQHAACAASPGGHVGCDVIPRR